MNVSTITVPKNEAEEAIKHYQQSVKERHNEEDAAILRGYKEIIKGHELLNIHEVFQNVELDEKSRPKLAICQAAQKHVYCHLGNSSCRFGWKLKGRWDNEISESRLHSVKVPLPEDSNRIALNGWSRLLKGAVPIIPPQFRPQKIQHNHYILWEVDEWEEIPTDPFLLKHLGGAMYAVLAAWDLTPLERAVLAETRAVN